jgi:predicted RNA-binding Zn ribbon-like protein
MAETPPTYTLTQTPKLVGGAPCVDFANTADWHASEGPLERLTTYSGLVYWSWHAGVITPVTAQRLLEKAGRHPREAEAVLDRAIRLREALYRIFRSLACDEGVAEKELSVLNEVLSEAMPRLRVRPAEEGEFTWEWDGMEGSLEAMLWPLARSAADLLTSQDQHRLGQCADDRGCGWLFLDRSKNHSRRWCDMEDCGNRAKAHRHYRRARGLPVD